MDVHKLYLSLIICYSKLSMLWAEPDRPNVRYQPHMDRNPTSLASVDYTGTVQIDQNDHYD